MARRMLKNERIPAKLFAGATFGALCPPFMPQTGSFAPPLTGDCNQEYL